MGSKNSRCSYKTSMIKTAETSLMLQLLAVSIILLTAAVESSTASAKHSKLVRRERAITGRSISFWGEWGQWSGCSRSCGGGVASQVRPCLRRRRSGTIGVGHHCVGLYRQYKQCNTKPCPEDSKDFRTEQCESFNNIPFMGKLYEWYPFIKEPMVCELNCRASGYRFYAKHADKVVDGTPCRPGETDVCVNGMCKKVGCDGVLSSGLVYDKCGICGGDNTKCEVRKGTFGTETMAVGYNNIVTIPAGAMYINITEVAQSRNYLALEGTNGDPYINGDWTVVKAGNYSVAGTTFQYKRTSEGRTGSGQQLLASGPTNADIIVQLIFQKTNPGVEYEYVLLTEPIPTTKSTTETTAAKQTSPSRIKHQRQHSGSDSTNKQSGSKKKKKGNKKGQAALHERRTPTGSPAVASPEKPQDNKPKFYNMGSQVLPPNLLPNSRTPIDSGGLWPDGHPNQQGTENPVPTNPTSLVERRTTEFPDNNQNTPDSPRRHHHSSDVDTTNVHAEEGKVINAESSIQQEGNDRTEKQKSGNKDPSGVPTSEPKISSLNTGRSSPTEISSTDKLSPESVQTSQSGDRTILSGDISPSPSDGSSPTKETSPSNEAFPTGDSSQDESLHKHVSSPVRNEATQETPATEKPFKDEIPPSSEPTQDREIDGKTSQSKGIKDHDVTSTEEVVAPGTLEGTSNGNRNLEQSGLTTAAPQVNGLNVPQSTGVRTSHDTNPPKNPIYPNAGVRLPGSLPDGRPQVINPYKPGFYPPTNGRGQADDALTGGNPRGSGQYPNNHGYPQNGGYQQNGGSQQNGGYQQNGRYPQNSGSPQKGGYQQNGGYPQNGGYQQNSGYQQNGGYPQNGGYQQNGGQNGPYPQNGGFQPNGGLPQSGHSPDGGSGYTPKRGVAESGYPPRTNVGGGHRQTGNQDQLGDGEGTGFVLANGEPNPDSSTGVQEGKSPVVNAYKPGEVGPEDIIYLWQEIGLSDCSVTCAGGTQHRVVICFNVQSATEADDSFCDDRYKPPLKTTMCNTQPCPAMWEVGNWNHCSRSCGRGMQMRQVICKQKKSVSLTTIVDMGNCDASNIPDKVQECSLARCTMWKTDRWQACSAQCGDGVQRRDITCIDDNMNQVDDSSCDPQTRPQDSIACSGPVCDTMWFTGDWPRTCTRECGGGQMSRVTVCTTIGLDGDLGNSQCDIATKPREVKACNSQACGAKWFASDWGQCSVECGTGVQVRDVLCISKNIPKRILDDAACPAQSKPAEEQPCELTSCAPIWLKTDWSECSKTCGGGLQTREVKCMSRDMESSTECDENRRPDTQQQCNKKECTLITQPSSTCRDRYTYCNKVAQARLCSYAFYKKYCCHSCYGRSR